MAVYMVGMLNIHNTDWMEAYRPKTAELIAKHGGRYVAAGAPLEVLEGDGTPPGGAVVLEFPSKEAALAWYNDPEYAPMIKLRQTGADGMILMVDGV